MMRHTPASIERNIALSAAAHVLLFGTALAFAHYGGGTFRADRTVITVSLFSESRGVAATHTVAKRAKGEESVTVRAEPDHGSATDHVPSLVPHHVWPVSEGTGQGQQEQVHGTGGPGVAGNDTVPRTDGNSAGQLFGYSSVEWQWLQASLERVKTYPRLARERGIEGTVLIRFRADASGNIQQADVVKSSGARILDEASIQTIYRAAPVPYVDGWVEVPMVYQLKQAEVK